MCVVLCRVVFLSFLFFGVFVGLDEFYMKIHIKRHLQRTYSSHFLLLPFQYFFTSTYNASFGGEICVSATYTADNLDIYLNLAPLICTVVSLSLMSKSKNAMESHPHSVGIPYFRRNWLFAVTCLNILNNYVSHTSSLL